ncbi:MAG TPA: magnesium/cobalt transporter CorA [Candidatus Deferrimicrobiaceae bacterium]
MAHRRRKRWQKPGTMPGTLTAHAEAALCPVSLSAIAYDEHDYREWTLPVSEVATLAPPGNGVLWIDVCGLGDPAVVQAIGDRFHFHRLALEDVLNVPQRPKVDSYEGHRLIVLREFRYPEPPEQVSMFLAPGVVVTFQERPGDAFEPVRERLRKAAGAIRSSGADLLAYALCDAVIDSFFPALEKIGDLVDLLEDKVLAEPVPDTFREIRNLKRLLLDVRHASWPARDAINELIRDESGLIAPGTKTYLRDCYDHTVQVLDMVETYREVASSLVDEYMTSVSNRMNEIMKVLTIIATIFMPLSFVVGLYGMNFDRTSPYNLPELGWRYGYPAVLLLMAVATAGMIWFFRRKKWM